MAKNTMKKLAIIVSIYNVKTYLSKCVFSIVSQMTNECELILVDDGSNDGSLKMLEQIVPAKSQYKIVHKENGGLSDARNVGLKYVNAEYVTFVDGDDYIGDCYVEEILNFVKRFNPEMILFGYDVVSDDGKMQKRNVIQGRVLSANNLNKENIAMLGYAWNKVYKVSIINSNGLTYEVGTSYIEDIIFNDKYISCINKVFLIEKSLYKYVQHYSLSLGKASYSDMLGLDIRANDALRNILKSLDVSDEKTDFLCNINIVNRIIYSVNTIIEKGNNLGPLNDYSQFLKCSNIKSSSKKTKMQLVAIKYKMTMLMKAVKKIKKMNVKSKIPFWMKFRIKTIIQKDNKKYSRSDKKIFVFLAANYGNLGDVLITDAQEKFLKDVFPDHLVYKIYVDRLEYEFKSILKNKNKDDICVIAGGGNLGNKYEQLEYQREFVIKKMKNNKIISFPQTLTTKSNEDVEFLKKVIKIYDKKNVLLFCREEETFKKIKANYRRAKIVLSPDIALYLQSECRQRKTSGRILFCLRDDGEKVGCGLPTIRELSKYDMIFRDTQIEYDHLSDEDRLRELRKMMKNINDSSLVVTDRLHGMILAKIMNRPFIALDNYNKKISRVYECWLSEKDGIMINNFMDLTPELIEKVVGSYKPTRFNAEYFDMMKREVVELIESE